MGILLKKPGSAAAKPIPHPTPIPSQPEGEWHSPFRESFHTESGTPAKVEAAPAISTPAKAGDVQPLPAAATSTAPVFKPKAVIRIIGGKPIKPSLQVKQPVSQDPTADLVAAGLADPQRELTSAEKWPPVAPGQHVVITNNLFPWVKHYKPGDIARVLSSSPTHSLPDDPYKYRSYFLEIISDGPTKGQKPMLFRWEFEPRHDATPPKRIEGRVITQN
jgi:hypothetical protein